MLLLLDRPCCEYPGVLKEGIEQVVLQMLQSPTKLSTTTVVAGFPLSSELVDLRCPGRCLKEVASRVMFRPITCEVPSCGGRLSPAAVRGTSGTSMKARGSMQEGTASDLALCFTEEDALLLPTMKCLQHQCCQKCTSLQPQ